jgi:threonine synthase
VAVELVDDEQIQSRIRSDYQQSGYVWCPHSATAAEAYARLPEEERSERPWIAAATAHPYKFRETVEPLIGRAVDPTPALAAILERASRKTETAPTLDALAAALRENETVA